MATGYLITFIFIAAFVLHKVIQNYLINHQPILENPQHQKITELVQSGQVFQGKVEIPEEDCIAVYTVTLRFDKKGYHYQTFRNGIAFEELRNKKFEVLAAQIEQRGILQLEELDLPF